MAKQWEKLFREVNELVERGCIGIFDQATKIVAIRDDSEFFDHHGGDLSKMHSALDPLTRNLVTLNLTELVEMLRVEPNRDEWTPANISSIHSRAVDAVVSRRYVAPPTKTAASFAGKVLAEYQHALTDDQREYVRDAKPDKDGAEGEERLKLKIAELEAKLREEHRRRLAAERELERVKRRLSRLCELQVTS